MPLAAALCALAPALGWAAHVVDPRPRFAVADRFPGAERVLALESQLAVMAGQLDRLRAELARAADDLRDQVREAERSSRHDLVPLAHMAIVRVGKRRR